MSDTVTLLGIRLHRIDREALHDALERAINGAKQTLLATTNPEMLYAASHAQEIARSLKAFDWRIPDGFGITLMSFVTGHGIILRHPGVDLFVDLCRLAAQHNKRVVVLGGWGDANEKALRELRSMIPTLDIQGIGDVVVRLCDDAWQQPSTLLENLRALKPDVIAVALGGAAHARQERWIVEHAKHMPSAKIIMGIGGALNMLAGKIPRAPKLMQRLGIEWLWRFLHEPSRAERMWHA
ncbi:WecB/TagA/CpsF family glycosyltransferase, partial [Candidatus Uhrbacteria bacterium]|nr:WecB/TagA/CpsF family glycosyltransferase [Candidatus Uhrbacteria bacterium]